MSEEIIIRFRWTKEELTRATKWHYKQNASRKMLSVLFAAGGTLSLVVGTIKYIHVGMASQTIWTFAGGAYCLIIVGLFRFLAIWAVRRSYAKSSSRDSKIEWRITEEKLLISHDHGAAELRWSIFVKAVQTPEGLLLYPQPAMSHWLPRHAFASEADYNATAAMAQRHVPVFRQIS